MCRSVFTFAAVGLIDRYRVETLAVSYRQLDLSPSKTAAIFSSSGSTIRVEAKTLAWMSTVLFWVTRTVRASLTPGAGERGSTSAPDSTAADTRTNRRTVKRIEIPFLNGLGTKHFERPFVTDFLDGFGATEAVLGAGSEEPIALGVQVEPDDLRETSAFEQSLPRRKGSQIENLLVVQMEERLVTFTVEGRIRQKEKGGAGIDDEIGIVAKIVGRLGQ